MAIFQQNLPASVRFGPPASQENRGVPVADRRPYLVTIPQRKSAVVTRQTAASTRQFFALFPHESEDARITGATRSLYRRLLALNLPRPVARVEPAELREVSETRFTAASTRIA
jgi:hypothetical protein